MIELKTGTCLAVFILVWNGALSAVVHHAENVHRGPVADLSVSLAVYSGLPDPRWTLTPDSPSYPSILSRLEKHKGDRLPSNLGYKGFVVTLLTPHAGVPTTYEVPRCSDTVLEATLLNTAINVGENIKTMVEQQINNCPQILFI